MYLGDEAFVLRMQALASDRAVSAKEIPKALRASPKSLQDWLTLMPSRDDAMVAAHRHSQWSMSDIAQKLGLSVSRVSKILARPHASGEGVAATATSRSGPAPAGE